MSLPNIFTIFPSADVSSQGSFLPVGFVASVIHTASLGTNIIDYVQVRAFNATGTDSVLELFLGEEPVPLKSPVRAGAGLVMIVDLDLSQSQVLKARCAVSDVIYLNVLVRRQEIELP